MFLNILTIRNVSNFILPFSHSRFPIYIHTNDTLCKLCFKLFVQDSKVRVSEVGILGLIEHYCECSVEYTKFYNTTLSCSEGSVTFSSTIAHASNDGAVTAAVLVETFEAALSKEDNPTVTIDGQELEVSVPVDEETLSASSMGLLVAVIAASCSVHVCMATCIIIIW